jgi:hypothetical protein
MSLLQSLHLHDTAAGLPHPDQTWRYEYTKDHPVMRHLPTKCAEFVGNNYSQFLQLPPDLKQNDQWTVPGLNYILKHVFIGDVRVFGAIEFESDLFLGTPKARCYPFSFDKKWGKNIQVEPPTISPSPFVYFQFNDITRYLDITQDILTCPKTS